MLRVVTDAGLTVARAEGTAECAALMGAMYVRDGGRLSMRDDANTEIAVIGETTLPPPLLDALTLTAVPGEAMAAEIVVTNVYAETLVDYGDGYAEKLTIDAGPGEIRCVHDYEPGSFRVTAREGIREAEVWISFTEAQGPAANGEPPS